MGKSKAASETHFYGLLLTEQFIWTRDMCQFKSNAGICHDYVIQPFARSKHKYIFGVQIYAK